MTNPGNDSLQRFHPHDAVQLIAAHGDHEAGTWGRIVGRYNRPDPTWVVSFDSGSPCVELRGDQLAAA